MVPVSRNSTNSDSIFDFAHEQSMKVRKKIGSYEYEDDSFTLSNYEIIGLSNKQSYQGQTNEEGHPHGLGALVQADGGLYEGQFENGVREGQGRLIHASGDYYEGEWVNGKAEGTGTFTTIDGQVYEGDWEADRKHGHGLEIWADGTT